MHSRAFAPAFIVVFVGFLLLLLLPQVMAVTASDISRAHAWLLKVFSPPPPPSSYI